MFHFKSPLALSQVGLLVIWPLKSWVRGSRDRCGASALLCQDFGSCCPAGILAERGGQRISSPGQALTFSLPYTHASEYLEPTTPPVTNIYKYSLNIPLHTHFQWRWTEASAVHRWIGIKTVHAIAPSFCRGRI